jgi:tyrosyl-tRNA synthetase
MGGNDQQGNLVAGADYVRKTTGGEVFGLTQPLLLTASGTKFGKTEEGAVWLDPQRTSPYKFYQFWINTDDKDVERLLKLFTFLPLDEIAAVMTEHAKKPEGRGAQRKLAFETTKLVHGEKTTSNVVSASEILFSAKSLTSAGEETLAMLKDEMPFSRLVLSEIQMGAEPKVSLVDVLTACGACESKGEAKRAIKQGGISVNEIRAEDEAVITRDKLLQGKYLFIRLGKKRFYLVQID